MPTIVLMVALNLGNILNAGFDQVFNLYNPKMCIRDRCGVDLRQYLKSVVVKQLLDFDIGNHIANFVPKKDIRTPFVQCGAVESGHELGHLADVLLMGQKRPAVNQRQAVIEKMRVDLRLQGLEPVSYTHLNSDCDRQLYVSGENACLCQKAVRVYGRKCRPSGYAG